MNWVAPSPRRGQHERLLDRSFIGRAVSFPQFLFQLGARSQGRASRAVPSLVQPQKIQSTKTDQAWPHIGKRSARLERRPGNKTDASVANARNLAARQNPAGRL